ncbi:uracil-DNA glycosylase [Dehalogenimonas alkenigignens]|jgi:uracil-DNA glycosylase|uniref:uracil-DNA glycosylase n=1 Tax=Dehalogenimonas alkenigignens TaxID=1217799 RepID=UPI000D565274|nr:uracil-DNA glycosylase [Dehalogenimonas alkenigignens]PVV83316.1 uracil-DNA glycosylase [Dehalogenimonas alkenigignens]
MADATALEALAREIAGCKRCALAAGRTYAVPGEGNPSAEIMFIGEGPGFNEDQTGRPFCGAAGQFLTQLIESIGLKRQDVYITNIVKSRPPGNRDPLPEEILACKPWLDRQLEIIKPKVIVTLGRFSMARFFPGATISRIHGQAEKCGAYTCFAMYHPAAALHQGSLRAVIEADMLKLPKILEDIRKSERPAAPAAQTEPAPAEAHSQLKLFGF